MTFPSRWGILLISLWTQVGFLPWIHCKDGTVVHVSREDLLAVKDEQNPKCFTRTQWKGICFFDTADNRTYDMFYNVYKWKMCQMSVQETEEGTFRHICSFTPFFIVETNLKVVEHNTNATLYNRSVKMHELILLSPPFSVSLHQTGEAGQLKVSWQSTISIYQKRTAIYMIRYSSKTLGEKTIEAKEGDILDSLVPGEEVEVQVKSAALKTGLWSSWSHPVRAVVPQSADDISPMCYTSDLQHITCQWNGSRYGEENEYKLYYKMSLSEVSGWTDWTECLADRNLTDLCSFRVDESSKVRVKLSNAPAPLSRTFYTQEFTLRNSIKTSPPSHLRGALENGRLCLKWEAPLPSPSAHLQYKVSYQIRGTEGKMSAGPNDPHAGKCLPVPAGIKYSVKIRARPVGSIYSGYWSDWSDELTGDTPADENTLLLLLLFLIPALMLITAIVLFYRFNTPLRKFKLYIWPPVPNLDKVLQGYLTEINGQNWNPPLITKHCSEETIPSLVEIMSDDEVSGSGKPSEESTQLLSPEGSFSCREQVDGSPRTQVFPDYVTLNKDSVILCPNGNKYIVEYETSACEKEAPAVKNELLQTSNSSCADGSVCTEPCCTDFLNHSYLLLAEPADGVHCKVIATRVPGNIYTNLPCS